MSIPYKKRKRPWYAHGNYHGPYWSGGENQASVESNVPPTDVDDLYAKEHDAWIARHKRARFGDPGARDNDFEFARREWESGTVRGKISAIAVGAQGAARSLVGLFNGVRSESTLNKLNIMEGSTRNTSRPVRRQMKPFSKMKVLSGGIKQHVQQLGMVTATGAAADPALRHLVSEFNPTQPGMIIIPQKSGTSGNPRFTDILPMQVFDLNHYVYNIRDNQGNWGTNGTAQCDDVNCRAWVWKNSNIFGAMRDLPTAVTNINDPRYYISDPLGNESNTVQFNKRSVYRGSINVKFAAYGCAKTPMSYDFMIIKCLEPQMCPDYFQTLGGDDLIKFRQRWQRLIRGFVCNPLLQGVEPGITDKKWFKVLARKTVNLPEQTTATDTIPTYTGSLNLKLNELNNHVWSMGGQTVDTGAAAYDNVPGVNLDINSINAFQSKPFYTSRYYLVVRANATVDIGGQDGTVTESATDSQFFKTDRAAHFNFVPSYDLVVKNVYYNTQD